MKSYFLLPAALLLSAVVYSQHFVTDKNETGAFPIVAGSRATAIYVEKNDHWLVQKAAALLQEDIRKVTGSTPEILHTLPASALNLIIIGSLDRSPLMARLAGERRINADSLKGKWEAFSLQVVTNPAAGIGKALIITGSDRRGAAFGVFELSRQIGVSPWYWWADVPVKKKNELYVKNGVWNYGPPAVKYRGFFINDEAPAFSGWTREKFGGVNHLVYEKIFELLLRMKANFLWPAMWGNAFNDDDTLNPILADKYGIVMGTSHHEPMLRAQQEWKRYGSGPWNYETNKATLDSFWRKGIRNMGSHESIVTIGMRGDGDKPMTEGSNIALLEQIVADQRKILQETSGKDPATIPQAWALYKEVQDYYDKGMRVSDDVTLLLCDDNWGNVRKLPRLGEQPRAGGYGMYYHFDYVGDPRNYKWLNTNQIARAWEQMHLCWQYGVDRIWIVNIGDIKPMEFPTEFFLDYAWNPGKWPAERLDEYTRAWAAAQFGEDHAVAIADILTKYTRFNARRKPELLSPDTYSLLNYREAETVVGDYNRLAGRADSIYRLLPADYRDAFYQLVLFPVKACANLNELYVTAGMNRLYAAQGRAATDSLAERVAALFAQDSLLCNYYNKVMAGGKWDHMMDQTHIGYTYWQQPPVNKMPQVITNELPAAANMGVAIEGSASWWPLDTARGVLPVFASSGQRSHYIEVFNRGQTPFTYTAGAEVPWLDIRPRKGTVSRQERIWINVDWARAPIGVSRVPVTITAADGRRILVDAIVRNTSLPPQGHGKNFLEANGYVSIEAEHYTASVGKWQRIPGLGRTLSGMEFSSVTSPRRSPGGNGPRLEYRMTLTDTGTLDVQAWFSPALDFSSKGMRYGISLDDEEPQIIDLTAAGEERNAWSKMVADNIKISASLHRVTRTGEHVLKFWLVDPGPVLQKIVVDAGGLKPSYLGPPESSH